MPAEVYVRGVKEALGELDAIQARVDAATLAAMKSAQTVAKAQIKSGMRGRPRWDKRGPIKSGRAAPAVNLNLSPHHVTKSGGPGSLTGHLRSAVGAVKRPKRTGQAQYSGGVGVGGPRSSTQIYRKEVEADYPYMAPGVKKAEAKMSAVWQKAWARAMDK